MPNRSATSSRVEKSPLAMLCRDSSILRSVLRESSGSNRIPSVIFVIFRRISSYVSLGISRYVSSSLFVVTRIFIVVVSAIGILGYATVYLKIALFYVTLFRLPRRIYSRFVSALAIATSAPLRRTRASAVRQGGSRTPSSNRRLKKTEELLLALHAQLLRLAVAARDLARENLQHRRLALGLAAAAHEDVLELPRVRLREFRHMLTPASSLAS